MYETLGWLSSHLKDIHPYHASPLWSVQMVFGRLMSSMYPIHCATHHRQKLSVPSRMGEFHRTPLFYDWLFIRIVNWRLLFENRSFSLLWIEKSVLTTKPVSYNCGWTVRSSCVPPFSRLLLPTFERVDSSKVSWALPLFTETSFLRWDLASFRCISISHVPVFVITDGVSTAFTMAVSLLLANSTNEVWSWQSATDYPLDEVGDP